MIYINTYTYIYIYSPLKNIKSSKAQNQSRLARLQTLINICMNLKKGLLIGLKFKANKCFVSCKRYAFVTCFRCLLNLNFHYRRCKTSKAKTLLKFVEVAVSSNLLLSITVHEETKLY